MKKYRSNNLRLAIYRCKSELFTRQSVIGTTFKNQSEVGTISGFALMETIVALLILSFALVGLLTMVQYARVRAIANYNDRYVLLRLDGEMQKIRYQYETTGNFGSLNVAVFQIPNPGNYTARPVQVTVNFSRTMDWDNAVGGNVGFNKIIATAEWNENLPRLGGQRIRAERRFITLREDYFFQEQGN